MRKILQTIFTAVLFHMAFPPAALAATAPSLDLEQKIAYQQGQFGALYARCGSHDDKIVIGGTLANWRKETFAQYSGSAQEHASLEKAFDTAASDVAEESDVCRDWQKQASATWHGIVQLSEHGTPVALSKSE